LPKARIAYPSANLKADGRTSASTRSYRYNRQFSGYQVLYERSSSEGQARRNDQRE